MPSLFRLKLILSAHRNVLWTKIAEQLFQDLLDQPTTQIIQNHHHRDCQLELVAELDQSQLLVHFRDKFRGARESYTRDEDESPVHSAIFTYRFSEGTTLIVDSESGYLLDKLKQIDSAIEKGRFKFPFQVNFPGSPASRY